jgi:hypothetical protein
VVVWQANDVQARQVAGRFVLAELEQPVVDALGIGDVEVPAGIGRRDEADQPGHGRRRHDVAGRRSRRVFDELAIAADADVRPAGVVPEIAARAAR